MTAAPLLAHAQSTSLLTIMGPTLKYGPAAGKLDLQPGTTAGTPRDAANAIAAEQLALATAQAAVPSATLDKANGPAKKDAQGTISAQRVLPTRGTVQRALADMASDTGIVLNFGAICNGC